MDNPSVHKTKRFPSLSGIDHAEALSIAEELLLLRERSKIERQGLKIDPVLRNEIACRVSYLDYLLNDSAYFPEESAVSTQQAISAELLTDYGYDVTKPAAPKKLFSALFSKPSHPRKDYLLSKYQYLQKTQLIAKKKLAEETGENRSGLRKLFDIVKKIVDILDDVWSLLRGALPVAIFNAISPFLTGGVGFIIHLAELHQAVKEGKKASETKKMPQRNARIVSNTLISFFALIGLGLSITLLASGLGYAVLVGLGPAAYLGLILTPAITGLLLTIYSIELVKRSYVLHAAIKDEILHHKALHDHTYITAVLEKVKNATPLTNEEKYLVKHYRKEYPYDPRKICKDHTNQRILAERNVAFGAVEVLASLFVTAGTSLFSLVALSSLTLGTLPMGLLIAGVVLGVLCKYIDRQDEKRDFAWTRSLREWLLGYDPIKKLDENQKVKSTHAVTLTALPTVKIKASSTPIALTKANDATLTNTPFTTFAENKCQRETLFATPAEPLSLTMGG